LSGLGNRGVPPVRAESTHATDLEDFQTTSTYSFPDNALGASLGHIVFIGLAAFHGCCAPSVNSHYLLPPINGCNDARVCYLRSRYVVPRLGLGTGQPSYNPRSSSTKSLVTHWGSRNRRISWGTVVPSWAHSWGYPGKSLRPKAV